MTERQRVQFLLQPVTRFAAQVRCLFRAAGILVRLLFVKHNLLQDQFHRRKLFRVEQVGHQPVDFVVARSLRVVELVFCIQ